MTDALGRDAIIRTVYGEARGETTEGQAAVTHVVLNRVAQPGWWGRDAWHVCHTRSQFSCWNLDDPNAEKLEHLSPNDPGYVRIAAVVDTVLAGRFPDATHGATHYKVIGTKATWDKATVGVTPVCIGHHAFFKLSLTA